MMLTKADKQTFMPHLEKGGEQVDTIMLMTPVIGSKTRPSANTDPHYTIRALDTNHRTKTKAQQTDMTRQSPDWSQAGALHILAYASGSRTKYSLLYLQVWACYGAL